MKHPLRLALQEKLTESKKVGLSLRQLAKSVGMSPGSLSSFLKGDRDLTWETAKKIIDQLDFDSDLFEATSDFYKSFNDKKSRVKKISLKQAEEIYEWQNWAILNLLEADLQDYSAIALGQRLGLKAMLSARILMSLKK